jgi:pyrroline-5-carboxylate reductase
MATRKTKTAAGARVQRAPKAVARKKSAPKAEAAKKAVPKAAAKKPPAAAPVEIGFIGGGNMAEAMVKGLLASGRSPASMMVAEPDAAKARALSRRYGVAVVGDNAVVMKAARTVVLAVKPQILGDVMAGLAPLASKRHLFVSIAAGVTLQRLEKGLGGAARVVRVMPNTPCLVGKGASVLCAGKHATAADLRLAKSMFAAVGDAHVVRDEKLLHAVTALSGSGPAYVYRFAEALLEGAVRGGLDPALARALTLQTLAGAAQMMIETGQDPAELRRAVSSPGGTTLAGLGVLDDRGLVETVKAALAAAARRSVELGKA